MPSHEVRKQNEESAWKEAVALQTQIENGNLRGRSVIGARARRSGGAARRETDMQRRFGNWFVSHGGIV